MFTEEQANQLRQQQQELRKRYQRVQAGDLPVFVQEAEGQEPGTAPVSPPPSISGPPQKESTPPQISPDDQPIFPGGPLESQVLSWKKQFQTIYLMNIQDEYYIFRPLNRYEYKQLMAIPNLDPLQREEIMCETCVLWPVDYTYDVMSASKAGVPAILAEEIMEKSGFTRNVIVQSL